MRRLTRTPRPSRPNSHSTGRFPIKSLQLAPFPPRIPRTDPLLELSSGVWMFVPVLFPALILAGACRSNAANLVPTATTVSSCQSMCQWALRNTCSTYSPRNAPPVPRHPRRRFDSSSTIRSGKYQRTPIGSRSRWYPLVMYDTHWTDSPDRPGNEK